MSDQPIKASEIGEYVYCRRAWWLHQVRGHAPRNVRELERGTQYHADHGRSVQRALYANKVGYALLFAAIFFFIYWWLV